MFRTIQLPNLHPNIDIHDLQDNLKLYTEDKIEEIKLAYNDQEKSDHTISYDGAYFAIYKGLKQEPEEARRNEVGWRYILGLGKTGRVKLAQNLDTSEWVALKVQAIEEELDESVLASPEVRVLHHLNSTVNSPKSNQPIHLIAKSRSKEIKQHFIPMKLVHGIDAFELIENAGIALAPIQWIDIALQMLQRVSELHQQGILHRDLKLENMLYSPETGRLYLVDFGFSGFVDQDKTIKDEKIVGTAGYAALELFKIAEDANIKTKVYEYSESTEVYALGVCIGKLLGLILEDGQLEEENGYDFIFFTKDRHPDRYARNLKLPKEIRDEVEAFIREMCLRIDLVENVSRRRKTINEAIYFFSSIKQKLALINRTLRIGFIDFSECARMLKDASDKNRFAFIMRLKDMHEIYLLDHDSRSLKEYLEVRQWLQRNKVVVAEEAFIFDNKKSHDLPADIMERIANKHHGCYYVFHRYKQDEFLRIENVRKSLLSSRGMFDRPALPEIKELDQEMLDVDRKNLCYDLNSMLQLNNIKMREANPDNRLEYQKKTLVYFLDLLKNKSVKVHYLAICYALVRERVFYEEDNVIDDLVQAWERLARPGLRLR